MIIRISYGGAVYEADLKKPVDISIPLREGADNPNCFGADKVKFETISSGNFIGSVKAGGSVNYRKITITPHGNGTHTECYGHIVGDPAITLNQCLKVFHFVSRVVSVVPERLADGDRVIHLHQLREVIETGIEALIIRSLPNGASKKSRSYTGTNPAYLDPALCSFLSKSGVDHLLVDLPSIDREQDEGKLPAHKAFWNFPEAVRKNVTVTELIYVDNQIPDGHYLLNLQITSLEADASPSKPVLFKLVKVL